MKAWPAILVSRICVLAVLLTGSGCTAAVPTPPLPTAEASPTGPPAESTPRSALPASDPAPSAAPRPTATPRPTSTPRPTITPIPFEWESLVPGLGLAYVPAPQPDLSLTAYNLVLRLDPARFRFRIFYDAGQPRTIEEWQEFTGAAIVVNGGFFSETNEPVGRLVIDGQEYGETFNTQRRIGVAGLLTLGDGQEIALYTLPRRSASASPISSPLALESYPMLLSAGGQPNYHYNNVNQRARRTAIGLDRAGNVLIVIANEPVYSLYEFAHWLATPSLDLDKALNLDGGRSTGLALNLGDRRLSYPAYVRLPVVLAIYPAGG